MNRAMRFLTAPLAALFLLNGLSLADETLSRLRDDLQPFADVLAGKTSAFAAQLELTLPDADDEVKVRISRFDDQAFDLAIEYGEDRAELCRRAETTLLRVPRHHAAFRGTGATAEADHLAPAGLADRMLGPGTRLSSLAPLLTGDLGVHLAVASPLLNLQWDEAAGEYRSGKKARLSFPEKGVLQLLVGDAQLIARLSDPETPEAITEVDGETITDISREELERQLARGARRGLEILAPSKQLTDPSRTARKIPHGELRWIGEQRVALLWGSPEDLGRAHATLLRDECQYCIDSVLYAFGTVQTVRSGRWFRHDLDEAWQRLSPHIPERHQQELRSLADELDLDPQLVASLNVFPELFHCSGFALFGTATEDGKLYHGRVLDYMTSIGLHDCATTFIMAPEGQIPFVNVGYAGFTGSVSGMNAATVSLGEMGGGGEGRWDGVPMATLMRRALEECSTLDEVRTLWTVSPRTCEYYYVFAQGNANRAVGVAATPEKIEFIEPGASDERLGPGIADAVVLSAGDRLTELRRRVEEQHGRINEETARNLMCRPVAMKSNLHNVLFVPSDGLLYIAHANHESPAAEREYTRLDFRALLKELEELAGRRPGASEPVNSQ